MVSAVALMGWLAWRGQGPEEAPPLAGNALSPAMATGSSSLAAAPSQSDPMVPVPEAVPEEKPRRILPPTDVLWQTIPVEPAFAGFRTWVDRYDRATESERPALEAEGVALAQRRREELRDLIGYDPRRALELAVPHSVRRRLPGAVVAELEERVEGQGDFEVLASVSAPGAEGTIPGVMRKVVMDGRRFNASAYGQRLFQPTQFGVPLHGIAVDDQMAVAESPIRRLEASEMAELGLNVRAPLCALDNAALAQSGEDGGVVGIAGERLAICLRTQEPVIRKSLPAQEY